MAFAIVVEREDCHIFSSHKIFSLTQNNIAIFTTMKFSIVSSFLLLLLAASPCIAAQAKLYSVHPFDNGNTLHQVDLETGATSSSLPLIGASGFRALATHPETDVLYAINQANDLHTVDPATGIATRIGRTVDWISSIAFDCSGKLYGVSGNQATPREALYDINTETGAATQLCTIGSNDGSFLQGVAIAWHPVEGKLYYSTGEVTNASVRTYGNVETILEVPGANCPLNDIQIDLGVTGFDTDAHAMTFSKAQDTFLYSIRNQQYFQVDADGTSSSLATLEDKARAFAIVPSTCRGKYPLVTFAPPLIAKIPQNPCIFCRRWKYEWRSAREKMGQQMVSTS